MLRSLYDSIKQYLPKPLRESLAHTHTVVTGALQKHVIRHYNKRLSFGPLYAKCLAGTYSVKGPQLVRLEPAGVCNLKCQHCPTGLRDSIAGGDSVQRGIMSETVFERIVQELGKVETLRDAVFYLGGEPLLNPRLPEMLRRVLSETSVLHAALNTNGMILNEARSRELLEARVATIQISIDGRTPEENDAQRLGAKYEVIRRNVLDLIDMAESHNTIVNIGNTILAKDETELTEASYPLEPPEFLAKDFGKDKITTNYAMTWPGHDRDTIERMGMRSVRKGYHERRHCIMPFTEICFRWNGDVVMCCYDITGGHVMGNIMEEDFFDIWNGEKYQEVRKAMGSFQRRAALPTICQQCPIYTREMLVAGTDSLSSPCE